MKILMFSDFHIGNDNFDINKSLKIIDKTYEAVSKELNNSETVIICGDIIDMGNSAKRLRIFNSFELIYILDNKIILNSGYAILTN